MSNPTKPFPHAIKYAPRVKGLQVIDYGPAHPGSRYMARAMDKERHKPVSEKFATIPECIAFGERKLAEFTTGIDRGGRVLMKDAVKEWLESKDARGNAEGGIAEQRGLMDRAMEYGITDLKSTTIIRDTQRFLKNLTSKRPVGKKSINSNRTLAPSTVRRYVMHFRDLGNFCCHASRRYLQFNPFQAVEAPTLDDTIMDVFNLDECRKFVSPQALCLTEGLYWAFRLYSGMRLQECSKLRWEHIMWDAKRIYVKLEFGKKVKRNKERLLILQDELIDLLRAKGTVQGEYVFSDKIRKRNNKSDITAFYAHCERLGITVGDRVGHSLRGTNASILLAAGLDPIGLMDHLGHTTLTMTRKYTRASQFFRESVSTWKGQIRLMPKCEGSVKAGLGNGSLTLTLDGEPAPEDEIDDLQIVMLPDASPVFTGTGGITEPIYTRVLGSSVERRVGSSPSVRTILEDNELGHESECLLRYGSD